MKSRERSGRTRFAALLLLSAVVGCAVRQAGAADGATAAEPLKVGVYVDRGPSGIGAVEWVRLVDESPEMDLTLLVGEDVRNGALDGLDLLIMPGGASKTEFVTLGTNGVEKLKDFIRNGGGYVGTCAGCCLLMDEPINRARVMPWKSRGSVHATFYPTFQLNERGAAALGLKKGPFEMRYHGGPCMWPTTNVIEGAKFEAWATYDAEASMKGRLKAKMRGAAAIVGGTYGKGRVFAVTAHPEYHNSTVYIVQAAIRWVTGRTVTFPTRRRSPRALSVGFFASGYNGKNSAKTVLALASEPDFDLVPVNDDGVRQRALDHVDVLVLNSGFLLKHEDVRKIVADFAANGGKVVGYGRGARTLPKGGIACGPAEDTVRAIRRLTSNR